MENTGYIAVIIILVVIAIGLAYMYIQKPTQNVSGYDSLNANYTSLKNNVSGYETQIINLQNKNSNLQSNLSHPQVEQLLSDYTAYVPERTGYEIFYNSTYNNYFNYTWDGNYNFTFYAPNDGYVIFHFIKSNIPIGDWAFALNSNVSSYQYGNFTQPLTTSFMNGSVTATAGWQSTPNATTSFYQIMPLVRGNNKFTLQNEDNKSAQITFSLTYVADRYSNMSTISVNP